MGHGAIDIRNRWADGKPVLMVEVVGPDQEQGAATLERTLEWADRNGVEAEIYETDGLLPAPGDRPDLETREYALNAIRMAHDLLTNPGPDQSYAHWCWDDLTVAALTGEGARNAVTVVR